jgi:ribosomal protein L37AE/L43A
MTHALVEDNHFCTACKGTYRMKREIGSKLWKCPHCGVLLAADRNDWGDTIQARSLRARLVKTAEQCEAENAAAGILLAARKAEGGSRK